MQYKIVNKQNKKDRQNRDGIGQNIKFLAVALLILACVMMLYLFFQYWSISNRIKNKEQVQTDQLLNILDKITKFPFFPQKELFYQEFVLQLARLSQWKLLLQKSNQALAYPSNQQKFSIYYHQSLAYLYLSETGGYNYYASCKKAALEAAEIAHFQKNTKKMELVKQVFLNLIEKKQMEKSEIPSFIDGISMGMSNLNQNLPQHSSKDEQSIQNL